jgi:hypothetical protein
MTQPPARPSVATPTKKGLYLTGVAGIPLDKLSFLTVHMAADLYNPSGPGRDAYVGAIPDQAEPDEKKRKWAKLDAAWIAKSKARFVHQPLWELPVDGSIHPAYLELFCDAAARALTGFTHDKRLDFCSGSPSSASCHAIVLKCLKRGFEAIGFKMDGPGLLQKVLGSGPVIGDVAPYVDQMLRGCHVLSNGDVLDGFEAVTLSEIPGPWGPKVKDTTFKWPNAPGGYMNAAEEFWASWSLPVNPKEAPKPNQDTEGVKAVAAGQKSQLKNPQKGMVWANVFAFRGDSRPPIVLRVAGGMFSNATRDDRQRHELAPAGADVNPVLDHVAHQLKGTLNTDTSGFVSTSSSRYASQEFIHRDLKTNGYIYLVRVRAGVVVNETWERPPSPQECEISVPGAIFWEDIVGWRQVKSDQLIGPLYLTKDSKALPSDKKAELKKAMSYKSR